MAISIVGGPPAPYTGGVGFALYVLDDVTWCKGTHEYRPMGAAVVAAGSVLTPRDFHGRRQVPRTAAGAFAGFFASLGEVNAFVRLCRSQRRRRNRRRRATSSLPIL
jgi:hypothetical protein